METNYEESYRRIMEYQNEEHLRNQKKIRWGIRCVILIPMIFLMLMFSMDSSKVVFLVLWIVSLFTISAYLIYVEYMDYTLQERLTELGIKEDGKIDTLLPNSSIDSRLAEMERKIAADRAILACMHGLIFYRTGARMDRMQRRILKLQLHRTTRGSRLTTPSLIWVKL